MSTFDLETGDRVQHPTFGEGTVTDISKEDKEAITEVNFDEGGKKRLAIRHAKLQKVTPDGLQDVYQKPEVSFDGFWGDPKEDEELHVHGNHWGIFFEDVIPFLEDHAPKIVPESQLAAGWAENHEPLYDLQNNESEAVLLCHPGGRCGIKSILKINREEGPPKLMSFFPFVSEGAQHTLKMNKVHVWEGRTEAQIEALVGDVMEITFFDTDFVLNKGFYGPEHPYQFILAGFAYRCRIDDTEPLDIPENTRKIFEQIKEEDPEFEIPEQLEMKGMAAFLPADGGDRDDFEFRGPVKKVEEIQMLDQIILRIRTTVARFMTNEEDDKFDLDIYVTSNALESHTPKIGDDISGILWLQGYMWYPGTDVPITKE